MHVKLGQGVEQIGARQNVGVDSHCVSSQSAGLRRAPQRFDSLRG